MKTQMECEEKQGNAGCEANEYQSAAPRKIDADVYIPVLVELIRQGKTVPLMITGSSMSPFMIHERDTILLGPVTKEPVRGTVALFQRRSGQYVVHRICRVDRQGQYYFVGDAQTQIEGPIDRKQILGVVTAVKRKGQWIRPGDFWWEFFEHVWLRIIPLRRPVWKLYGLLKHDGPEERNRV